VNANPLPYAVQYAISFVVALLLAAGGALVMAADPLGLTRQQVALIGVVTAVLGVVGTLGLPRAVASPARHEANKAAIAHVMEEQILGERDA
jgi:hypothetical protein